MWRCSSRCTARASLMTRTEFARHHSRTYLCVARSSSNLRCLSSTVLSAFPQRHNFASRHDDTVSVTPQQSRQCSTLADFLEEPPAKKVDDDNDKVVCTLFWGVTQPTLFNPSEWEKWTKQTSEEGGVSKEKTAQILEHLKSKDSTVKIAAWNDAIALGDSEEGLRQLYQARVVDHAVETYKDQKRLGDVQAIVHAAQLLALVAHHPQMGPWLYQRTPILESCNILLSKIPELEHAEAVIGLLSGLATNAQPIPIKLLKQMQPVCLWLIERGRCLTDNLFLGFVLQWVEEAIKLESTREFLFEDQRIIPTTWTSFLDAQSDPVRVNLLILLHMIVQNCPVAHVPETMQPYIADGCIELISTYDPKRRENVPTALINMLAGLVAEPSSPDLIPACQQFKYFLMNNVTASGKKGAAVLGAYGIPEFQS